MIHPDTRLAYINDEMGYGVFATKLIPAGTIIWTLDEWDIVIPKTKFASLKQSYKDLINFFAYDDALGNYILNWDLARYLNHSFNANTLSTGYNFDIAIKDIQPGEEITTDYANLYDEDFSIAFDQGADRKTVKPDDYRTLYKVWDAILISLFPLISQLDQPLQEIIDPKIWKEVIEVSKGNRKMKSTLSNFMIPEEFEKLSLSNNL